MPRQRMRVHHRGWHPRLLLWHHPALVGTWEIMVPSDRGMSRWIWRIMGDGTYKFRAEGPRAAPAHEGTIAAVNGHWSIHAN
jgi:hypothetical protein